MKTITCIVLLSIVLFSCAQDKSKDSNNSQSPDTKFSAYKEGLVLRLWKMYPSWASSVGYHNYDSLLTVPDAEHRNAELDFIHAEIDSLKSFDSNGLNDNNRTDFYLIDNQLKSAQWSITDMKSYEWDPSSYNVGSIFGEMLNNNYDSLDNRLHSFYLRMENIPAFYEAAKKNIVNPTKEHTALAIDQNTGSVSVFEKDLKEALDKSKLTADEKEKMLVRSGQAIAAINGYVEWLKKMKNDTPRTFRLGKDLYAKKFEYDIMSAYSPEEMYKKAVAHKKELHKSMAELSVKLWPEYMGKIKTPSDTLQMIRMVIDRLSEAHVKPELFQTAIEGQLKDLAAFIKTKDLIYMDPSKPLVVRKEPDYMAGVAGASISAPGPYDKSGNTYYNVGSLSGWPKEKSESYLKEYNH